MYLKIKAWCEYQVHLVKEHLNEKREKLCAAQLSATNLHPLPNIWFNLCIKVSAKLLLRLSDIICNQLHRERHHWNQCFCNTPLPYVQPLVQIPFTGYSNFYLYTVHFAYSGLWEFSVTYINGEKWKWLYSSHAEVCWPHLVRALDSGSSGLGLSPGQGHCVVFLSKTLYSHNTCTYLHPGV